VRIIVTQDEKISLFNAFRCLCFKKIIVELETSVQLVEIIVVTVTTVTICQTLGGYVLAYFE
jgi:hypothetical protein